MWEVLGSSIDVVHALLMAAWVLGLPLLFVHKWPRITRAYGIYAITFIVVSQLSQMLLGECFLTTLAGASWQKSASLSSLDTEEWFTVRLAKWVFALSPSHRAIVLTSEILVLVTAFGELLVLRARRRLQSGRTANCSRFHPETRQFGER